MRDSLAVDLRRLVEADARDAALGGTRELDPELDLLVIEHEGSVAGLSSKVKRLLRPPVMTVAAVAAVAAPILTLSSTARDLDLCRFRLACAIQE